MELLAIIFLAAGVWYWQDGMRSREIACLVSDANCKSRGVVFLDQSVVLHKVRLRRNEQGRMVIFREYGFEFASDGACRYKGRISLLGYKVREFEMEAYREAGGVEQLPH
ncbi:MAG: DUF3301 domain-containing protein [Gammaproteobacteria bacterium]|nr:DUF3301 domain-containing protein [Gammaproteobacteria bacterium]MDH5653773.1 DUF3301 domain-containing protein [Gammaproteobacteria bacterium]